MNIFDSMVLNMILLIFPTLLWLIYLIHNKNVGVQESDLLFNFSNVTTIYLLSKFGVPLIGDKFLLLINIPLIVAYFKKKKASIIMLSIIIVIYYYQNFNCLLFFLIFEYLIYYLIYYVTKNNSTKTIIIITLLKVFAFTICYIDLGNFSINNQQKVIDLLLINANFIFLLTLIIFIYIKFEDIIKYHMSLKELEQEKQYRASLFRITHEIKNPIAVCKGYLDMFDINNIEHSKRYIPILKNEIERTLILLKDFLYMTKIKIDKEIVDVIMVLEDVIDNFVPILKENNIEYDFKLIDDSVYIYGDYNRLMQVFINLIKNSVEAVDYDKQSKLKITTKLIDSSIYIYIYDNGIGIDEETLKKIMEPFFTTKPNGTGLGVSLTNEIIKAHGGEIKYTSLEKVETLVEIILPLIN